MAGSWLTPCSAAAVGPPNCSPRWRPLMSAPELPRIAGSIDELLAGVTDRRAIVADDGKSGNWLERVTLEGETFVVKHHSREADWIMRVSGDRVFWPFVLWQGGLFERVPACIDTAVVAMAKDGSGPGSKLAILMHDVGPYLVPEGDAPVSVEQHDGFLAHMAELHADLWGWTDDLGLQ